MSADLAAITVHTAELDALSREGVIERLEHAKEWLTSALARDAEIPEVREFKALVAMIHTYTVQKQLGKDMELVAAELVRRAERRIGVSIRRGQEAGTIGTPSDAKAHAGRVRQQKVYNYPLPPHPPFPSEIAPGEPLALNKAGIYHLTDGVADEQFEAALAAAKAEGNLSRRNVVKLVRNLTGNNVMQVQHRADTVVVPDRPEILHRTKRLNSERIVEQTVAAASDLVMPDLMAHVDYGQLDRDKIEGWVSSLSQSISALRSLRTRLEKEQTRG